MSKYYNVYYSVSSHVVLPLCYHVPLLVVYILHLINYYLHYGTYLYFILMLLVE